MDAILMLSIFGLGIAFGALIDTYIKLTRRK